MSVPIIPLRLTPEEALVLFDLLNRYHQEGEVEINHAAEDCVLRRLHGQMNGRLGNPLGISYQEALDSARQRVGRDALQAILSKQVHAE